MENKFIVKEVSILKNRISFDYEIQGDWKRYFNLSQKMFIEYNFDIEKVPGSIAVIPLISNILPIVWLCDAELVINELDKDFYEHLPDLKKGYMDMYPMLSFLGKLTVSRLVDNQKPDPKGAGVFFSGGVDAYTTLFRHLEERPFLMTLWGADVDLTDTEGWRNVENAVKSAAEEYNLKYISIKTNFRKIIKGGRLYRLVKSSGDGWWHGFQHGIGTIGHAAPIAYINGMKQVYIASSYYMGLKGTYTCASDPTIDNHMCFGSCYTIHDGYEMNRQDKVRYLISKKNELGSNIQLRVCWESKGGKNCCHCEKCYRTILEIVSEKGNPNEYGFVWGDADIHRCKWDMKTKIIIPKMSIDNFYLPIQDALKRNSESIPDIQKYEWFQTLDFSNFNNGIVKKTYSFFWKCWRYGWRLIGKVVGR